jgi:hypothetical protein
LTKSGGAAMRRGGAVGAVADDRVDALEVVEEA